MPYHIVLDTNVLLAALRSSRGASYKLLTILNDSHWQLNVSTALSAQVSAWMTKNCIEEKAKRVSWDKFQQVLNKVPDVEPEDYDKL
ncbi:PIN domain-containing protein [Chlorogloeopsis fritschii PCC 9212]|nr:PIN domain-containing protein [Chlorogloeopsis fritschii]